MNLLALVQRLQLECGVSGTISTTAGLVGSQGRLLAWINQAWNEVQTERDDWNFMRSSSLLGKGISFATVGGQASYPLGTGAGTCGVTAAQFGKWDSDSFRNYTTSAGFQNEMFLDEIPFDSWRNSYMLGAMRAVQTRPVAIAIGPDNSLCLGPPPNNQYTVTGDYFMAPTIMVADTDVPTGLPVQFHMIIVYKAMTYYGGYEAAPEVFQRGAQGYSTLLGQLQVTNSPEIGFAGALV